MNHILNGSTAPSAWYNFPPEGPPEGSTKISGPTVVEWMPPGADPESYRFTQYRDPETPDPVSNYDAASNSTWAVYFYDYVEEYSEYEE